MIIISAQSTQKHTALLNRLLPPDSSSTTALLQQLPLAMALPPTKYARGSATEHSETIIDASGPATEHSEEGRPLRIPIIEVAFSKGMWWSIPQEMSAELFAKFEAGQDAVYTWDWGDSRKGSWKPDDEETSINRYMIDFVHKQQRNIDNGRMRTIRVIWVRQEDATPQWTGQIQ